MIKYFTLSGLLTLIAAGGVPEETARTSANDQGRPGVSSAPVIEVAPNASSVVTPPPNPVVDIAICLDTSGSMDGLIDSARQKIWAIVNEFVFAEPMPTLRVALLTFGNDGHHAENGWVKQEVGLTEDLDMVSKLLFDQTTNGGTELVGRVVSEATRNLNWSQEFGALKLIVVAGNESADQDTVVRFGDASKLAITADIMVNAIYCGALTDAEAAGWQQVARLADGQFAAIDHQSGTLVMETPLDAQLAALSDDLNQTYLAFGANGSWNFRNQAAQDSNAAGLNNEAAASRAFCKANGLYNCASWDLVDATKQEGFDIGQVKIEDLPEEMRVMTVEQQMSYIDENGAKRAGLQQQINELGAQRQQFIEAELKKQQLDNTNSFDHAFREALRSQARAKGYRFKQPATASPEAQPIVPAAATGQQALQQATGQIPQTTGQVLQSTGQVLQTAGQATQHVQGAQTLTGQNSAQSYVAPGAQANGLPTVPAPAAGTPAPAAGTPAPAAGTPAPAAGTPAPATPAQTTPANGAPAKPVPVSPSPAKSASSTPKPIEVGTPTTQGSKQRVSKGQSLLQDC